METFCGSDLWDSQLTWNTTDPYFTYCFEETALTWPPLLFLLLFGASDVFNMRRAAHRGAGAVCRLNLWILAKTSLSLALVAVYVAQLVRITTELPHGAAIEGVDYVAPVAWLVAHVTAAGLAIMTYTRGIRSSGVQFLFWLLALVCQAVTFRSAVHHYDNGVKDKFEIVYLTRLIAFPLICIRFLLECFGNDALQNKGNRIPIGNPSPDKTSTFLSKILFLWYDSLAWKGYRCSLTRDDLWDLNPEDTSARQIADFGHQWRREKERATAAEPKGVAGISRPLAKCYGATFLFGSLLKLTADLLVFVQPEMVKHLVAHVTSDDPAWKGYLYITTIAMAAVIQSILTAASTKRSLLVGMRIRAALSNAIFRKALVISNSSKRETTVGEIVNLMAVDAPKFMELMSTINFALGSPFQIAISIWLLHNTLGASVFAGVGILVLLLPINGVLASFARRFQMEQMTLKDERIKLTGEVIGGIKVLKLYGWEPSYQEQIEKIRAKEILCLRKIAIRNVVSVFTFNSAPILVTLATFATYVLSDPDNVLNAEKTFVALSLFNIIRMPMVVLPMVIAMVVQATVSVNRLNKYLNMEELDKGAVTHDHKYVDPITVEHATFSWTDEMVTLQDINVRVKRGELVAVVGTIGSGKSSLLCSLLGDLRKHEGVVNTIGSLAYVSQGAWIQNATLRDNILFGDPFNAARYDRVLEACALKPDLAILQDGDQTEIGEKGINLSGGQKQRVALARAAYKGSAIYLLDDPLSAVDAHVGKHIFDNLIGPKGLLRRSTRVLVTHGISFLPQVDRIVVLKEGRVSESGTYKELLKRRGDFAYFLLQHLDIEEDGAELDPDMLSVISELEETFGSESDGVEGAATTGSESEDQRGSAGRAALTRILKRFPSKEERKPPVGVAPPPEKEIVPKGTAGTGLVEEESIAEGNIQLKVYGDYFRSAGLVVSFAAIFFTAAANGLLAYSNIWLSNWSNTATREEQQTGTTAQETTDKYLLGYGAIGAVQAVVTLLGQGALAIVCLKASGAIHSRALGRVLRAPMSYFDTTLLGRLINRFAKDVDTIDNLVPMNLRQFGINIFNLMAALVVISYTTPIFIAFIVPMIVIYFFLQRFYVATSRQLKRLESVTRSPIYSHLGETVAGSTTIRAFALENEFVLESERRIDENQKAGFPFNVASMWISLRLEFMGALIIFATCLFVLLSRDSLSPGEAGLAISYSLQVTALLSALARQGSELETNIVSVERMGELTEVPQEAAWDVTGSGSEGRPEWPSKGEVRFQNYQTRYREGLDLVLQGISCAIQPGEKVGVVGRTGAGKSSFTLALFRIIEAAGGQIYIDGVDISQLGLHELRTKITIIPQDPVLFSGTLRLNLDPFNQYSDDQVWKCLELAHLKPYVSQLAEGLQYTVEEEGKNFSVGQRQLICLARALLRKTRILVLDEATAAVDLETDDLIQATIRNEFAESSVITIAHRLNTIMDSNRVMVLDKGQIKEFDSPANLLADTGSVFWGMAHDAKLV